MSASRRWRLDMFYDCAGAFLAGAFFAAAFLAGAFLAGAFFAAAFLAGAFLAGALRVATLATPDGPAAGLLRRSLLGGSLLGTDSEVAGNVLEPGFDVVEAMGESAELLGDLGLDQADEVLGRLAATIDEVLDCLLGVLAT